MMAFHNLTIPAWGTLSLIEAAWLVAGAGVLLLALLGLRRALLDYEAALLAFESKTVLAARVLARGQIRHEVIRMLESFIILSLGIYAVTLPQPASISLSGLLISGGLITLAFLIALQGYLDKRQREEAERVLADD